MYRAVSQTLADQTHTACSACMCQCRPWFRAAISQVNLSFASWTSRTAGRHGKAAPYQYIFPCIVYSSRWCLKRRAARAQSLYVCLQCVRFSLQSWDCLDWLQPWIVACALAASSNQTRLLVKKPPVLSNKVSPRRLRNCCLFLQTRTLDPALLICSGVMNDSWTSLNTAMILFVTWYCHARIQALLKLLPYFLVMWDATVQGVLTYASLLTNYRQNCRWMLQTAYRHIASKVSGTLLALWWIRCLQHHWHPSA